MQKTSPRELDPLQTPSLSKTEELRIQLLGNDGIRESVSLRAYQLYEKRGAGHGRNLEDWAQAETEVLSPLIEQKLKPARENQKEPAKQVPLAKLSSRKPKQ